MKAGRKPIPTALKVAKGTDQKCRINPNEMKVLKIEQLPEPPEILNELGAEIWRKVCNELDRNGLLSNVDLEFIIAYCQQMSIYMECVDKVKSQGLVLKIKSSDYPINNPHIGIGNKALKSALEIGTSFGLTPSARSRITSNIKETGNPIANILSRIGTN
jgi:P27 family predicted phage terminase small subunit